MDDVVACRCITAENTLQCTPVTRRVKARDLPTIQEAEDIPRQTQDMATLERRLSNTSCHKRRRGINRKLKIRTAEVIIHK